MRRSLPLLIAAGLVAAIVALLASVPVAPTGRGLARGVVVERLHVSTRASAHGGISVGRATLIVLCAVALFAAGLLAGRQLLRRAEPELEASAGASADGQDDPLAAELAELIAERDLLRSRLADTTQPHASDRADALGLERDLLVREFIAIADGADERLTRRVLAALERAGVEPIEPRPGEPFSSSVHATAGVLPTEDEALDDTVAAVVRRGYRDHGKLLREADVQVYEAVDR